MIRIPVYGMLTQCPISAIDKQSYNLYVLVKECNAIGMGGGGFLRPSLFFSESNIYFEARDIVLDISFEFDKMRERREKKKQKQK